MAPRTLPRDILQRLSPSWRSQLARVRATAVTRGMSGARIWRLQTRPERYLKLAEADDARALSEEIARTQWLGARGIRVARIRRVYEGAGLTAMMTEAVSGTPADQIGGSAERVVAALGRGLARLHALPVRDCPFDEGRAVRLARAGAALERDEIDPAQFEPRNRSIAPRALLARLAARRLREEIVVAHGDATLSNLIVDVDGTVGFLDCGHVGRADRYLDLAVLAADIVDHFGPAAQAALARAYGIRRWSIAKATYYGDLYEFF